MVRIDYPEPQFRIKKEGTKEFIFDSQRKKWVLLTPEEWVRQNFIQYLVQVKNYPASLIAVEKELMLGDLRKRFDVLVYNKDHQPWMMIECKSTDIVLDESVIQQLLRYNLSIPVTYLVVTNGHYCLAGMRKEGRLEMVEEFPLFPYI